MKRLLSPLPIALLVGLVGLFALLGYGLAAGGAERRAGESSQLGEGAVAPPLALPKLSGDGRASLADYRGKVVLVNVWASWCPPCVDELPLIQKTHEMMSRRGGTVLGIDVKENSRAALAAVRRFGLPVPTLRDRDGSFVREWGQSGYPENYVIDRQGRVAAVRRSPVTQEWLDKTLPPLLDEQA